MSLKEPEIKKIEVPEGVKLSDMDGVLLKEITIKPPTAAALMDYGSVFESKGDGDEKGLVVNMNIAAQYAEDCCGIPKSSWRNETVPLGFAHKVWMEVANTVGKSIADYL